MPAQKLTIPIQLEVSTDTYNKLATAKKTKGNEFMTGVALGQMSSQFLDAYANGGVLVLPEHVKKIEEVCESRIDNGAQLASHVQKVKGREFGQYSFSVNIDPSIHPAIKEYAEVIGWSIDQVLEEVSHRIIRDNLMFYINNQTWEPVVYLTESQSAELQAVFGKKSVNGEDILSLIKGREVAA